MTDDKPKKLESNESADEMVVTPEAADTPVIDASEAAEFVDKLPSESGEQADESQSDDAKSGGTTAGDDDGGSVTGGLQAITYPPRNVMKKQVQEALIKMESKFLSDAKKYERRGDFFNLNETIAKVREIRLLLSELVKATYESLKNLWMKYVYNREQ